MANTKYQHVYTILISLLGKETNTIPICLSKKETFVYLRKLHYTSPVFVFQILKS